MVMEDETRKYLGEPWEVVRHVLGIRVLGSDGDPLFLCDSHNAAHLLTPADVAEYVMELKREVETLRAGAKADAEARLERERLERSWAEAINEDFV